MNSVAAPRAGRARRRLAGTCAIALAIGIWATGAAGEEGGKGKVIGKIVSSQTGEALGFANVVLYNAAESAGQLGSPVGGAATQADGTYRIEMAPGLYWMTVSYISFNTATIQDVRVEAGGVTELDMSLVPEAVKIETIEVNADAIKGGEATLLAKQRKAPAVSDAIGAEQIEKSTDDNAAEVLQRVTGLSVVDERFIYVRGLGERYSSTQVNGSAVGTPEPNKRVLPLDIFAAGLIENVTIQKTYTPDQPGDFGGGVINISTREFPGQRLWNLTVASGYNRISTGKAAMDYTGGATDYLGIDDGTRAIPDEVERIAGDKPVTLGGAGGGGLSVDQLKEIGRSFENVWTPQENTARPAANGNASYADEVRLFGRPLGFVAAGSYSSEINSTHEAQRSYTAELAPLTDYEAKRSVGEALWGLVGSGNYRLGASSTMNLQAMYNRSAEDETRFTEGYNGDQGADYRITRLRYIERGLFSTSGGMTHTLRPLFGSTLEWKVAYSQATRNEPDRRESVYQLVTDGEDENGEPADPYYALAYTGGFPPLSRLYGELHDQERAAEADWTVPFHFRGLESRLKAGVLFSDKDRDEGFRRFRYQLRGRLDTTLPPESLLVPENISPQGFLLTEDTRSTDAYVAEQKIGAQYVMVDVPLAKRLRAVTGIRFESTRQTATTRSVFVNTGPVVESVIDETDALPSVNLTYSLRPNMNLRAAYGKTINRPDLREMTPLSITDYSTVTGESGNPDLRRALLHNYDLRWEVYPSNRELLSVSGFYKKFIDPIEKAIAITPSPLIIPVNGEGGHLQGLELEGRIGLNRIHEGLAGLALNTNWTITESRTEVTKGEQTSKVRPLEGQSPYVFNTGLFFATPTGRLSGSVLYNVFGKRLAYAGIGVLPDVYEMSRSTIDATAAVGLARGLRLKLAAENLLDDEIRYEQGDADHVTELYRKGRSFGLSISTGT